MKMVTLGSTGITVPQNAFGALPIQRDDFDTASKILRRAYEGGMTFFDTARAYSDSEEKIGIALSDVRNKIYIATKTAAKTPDEMKSQLETSLKMLKTDYIDIYQFHQSTCCYRPGDGSGMYEQMEDFKRQKLIRHIGITSHQIDIADECVESGLYETMQFPFSYLSGDREMALVENCRSHNMGFIAMKALAGGLITNSRAAFAFMSGFDNAVPIWGVQHEHELEEWLSYFNEAPELNDELRSVIEKDRKELSQDFCRGCGYCMPCPQGIMINQCARISLMIRRAPSESWLAPAMQAEMEKIEHCLGCGQCKSRCPYELDTPNLLKRNLADYRRILAGEVSTESYLRPAQK